MSLINKVEKLAIKKNNKKKTKYIKRTKKEMIRDLLLVDNLKI